MIKSFIQYVQKHKKDVIIAAVLLAAAAAGAAFLIHKAVTISIGFYNIPQPISDELVYRISTIQKKNIKFAFLTDKKPLPKDIPGTYDIFFSWNGAVCTNLTKKANPVPKNLTEFLPSAIQKSVTINKKTYALPLLLDHFEISYYSALRKKEKRAIPQTLSELEDYLRYILKNTTADVPLCCAGADDRILSGLVSVLYESMYGSEKYAAAIEKIAKTGGDIEVLSNVIQKLKEWQSDGLLVNSWLSHSEKDVDFYMKERRCGVIFTTLSEHRAKPPVLIKYYDAQRFPAADDKINHSLIAPALNVMTFGKPAKTEKILESLILTQNQTALSTQTQLAITSRQAVSHDMQADDVRFWAASCAGGPVTDLASAAFTTEEARHSFAERIRKALETGYVKS